MLLRDPQIKENIIYAFTELSTSLNILILPFAYTLIDSVSYQVIPLKGLSLPVTTTIAIIIYFILAVIPPTLVSYYVLSPRIGFQLSMIIDGRIYFSFICKHISSMKDLVIARRNILFVTLYKSTLVTNMVISAYYDEKTYFCGNCSHILIPLFFFFSVINGTVTLLEITYILCTKKSFLNWVFLSSLKERSSDPKDHDKIDNETSAGHKMNHAKDRHQSEEFELRVFQQLSKRTSAPEDHHHLENENFDNVITELNKTDNAITDENINDNDITEDHHHLENESFDNVITEVNNTDNAITDVNINDNAITRLIITVKASSDDTVIRSIII
jgi:hypothetical protein